MESLTPGKSKQAAPPLALLMTPPADSVAREDLGKQIWAGLILRFEAQLSERDRWLFTHAPDNWTKSAEHMRLAHELDAFLIHDGLVQFGPLVFCSLDFLKRFWSWRNDNPDLFEQAGKALKNHALIWLGKEKAPWPPDLDKIADRVIEELEKLLRRMRDEFGSRRMAPSCSRVAAWMKLEIEARPEEFSTLRAELAMLCGWVENLARQNQDAARRLSGGQMRGDSFFYLWYSHLSKHRQKTVRNRTAHLRTHR
jgi:hypothetical protein